MQLTNQLPSSFARRSLFVIVVFISYFFAGRLGLLLAIPPGYSSAIFPSSGIALAALILFGHELLLGVFLGSLALNLSMLHSWSDVINEGGVIALLIATGVTLQGFVGATLVRRFVDTSNELIEKNSILKFYLIGGPLCCLISATVGVSTLYHFNVVTLQAYPFTWCNWWIGDVIGVFIVVPIIFCFFAQPRDLWKRRATSLLPLLFFSFSAVVFVYFNVSQWEINKQRNDFNDDSKAIVTTLQSNLRVYSSLLESTERFFSAKQNADRIDFDHFISPLIQHFPGIQAMEWLPVIQATERFSFEKKIQQEGYSDFAIKQHDSNSHMIRSSDKQEYVPVSFVEPFKGNEAAFGYDLSSNPTRLEALIKARSSGEEVASGRIKLVQEKEDHFGFLLIRAVYKNSTELNSISDVGRTQATQGYVLAVLRIHDILGHIEEDLQTKNIAMRVVDENAQNSHSESDRHQQNLYQTAAWTSALTETGLGQKITIHVGGRDWRVEFFPLPNYLVVNRTMQAWAILAGGLLFTCFLGFILLLITGQTEKVQRAVQERTKELSIIIDNIVDGIVTLDAQGIIKSCNPAAMAIFGFSDQDVIGCHLGLLLSGDNKYTYLNFMQDNIVHENKVNLNYRVVEGERADGTQFPMELAISRSIQSEQPLYVAVIRDITERTRVERIKNEFVSTVSHELRTPLTSISGTLRIVSAGVLGELSEQAKAMVDMAYKNCVRLTTMINDLLDMDKLIAGKMTIILHNQPLMPLISQALESMGAYGKQYNVSYQLISQEAVNVQVNADRMVQVMNNLLSNATKYSEPGAQVQVAVKTWTKSENRIVRIEVIDFGAGIPDAFRDKVFQKFSQADSSDTKIKGGTGLGLAISKELIECMHGEIGFISTPGKGSCFFVDLPVVV